MQASPPVPCPFQPHAVQREWGSHDLFQRPSPGRRLNAFTLARPRERQGAFTLVEILVVIAIIALVVAFMTPALTPLKSAADVTSTAYTVADALEAARTYAIANGTYVWVGFFEDDPTNLTPASPRLSGVGRLVLSIVAASQSNKYKDTTVDATTPHAFYPPPGPSPIAGNDSNPVILTPVGKLIQIKGVHLATLGTLPSRPSVPLAYQVADTAFTKHPPSFGSTPVVNPTTFNYPLSATGTNIQYTFVKIIEFDPKGSASKLLDFPASLLDVGLQAAHGNIADTTNANTVAIQVSATSGRPRIYRR